MFHVETLSPLSGRAGHKQACKAARKVQELSSKASNDKVVLDYPAEQPEAEAGSSSAPAETCDQCAKAVLVVLACLGCHQARYCSAKCQREAWYVFNLYLIFFFTLFTKPLL